MVVQNESSKKKEGGKNGKRIDGASQNKGHIPEVIKREQNKKKKKKKRKREGENSERNGQNQQFQGVFSIYHRASVVCTFK
jgi:hypothetical protein